MIKQNKRILILTSIVTLLPIFIGLLLWNQLPERIPTHWNTEGIVDGWSSKPFAIFGLTLIVFVVHWICVLATALDPKSKNISDKPLVLVLWIAPITSLITSSIVYATALGVEINMNFVMPLFMGALFILIGNYLPKCKQNYSVGIKVSWTLNSEENWNHTHRFSGVLWVIGGILIMATAFLETYMIMIGALICMTILPFVYSYLYYAKHEKQD